MPQTFDPYHRWLGIPREDQPPNHYRLIGVNLFESDADVIDSAVNRQMAHLRTFQGGPHAALSQRLLNEVAKARVCLLDTTKKAAYDICLRSTLNTSRLPPNTASPPPPPPPPAVNLVQAALTGAETQHENAFDIAELVQQASHVPKRSAQPGEADKPGRDGRKKRRISSTAISALVVGSSILARTRFLVDYVDHNKACGATRCDREDGALPTSAFSRAVGTRGSGKNVFRPGHGRSPCCGQTPV